MTEAYLLRVSTLRNQNPRGFGGCIFTGVPIDAHGDIVDAQSYFVVRCTGRQLGDTRVQIGQWWRVTGRPESHPITVNGYHFNEWQIEARELELLLPSGEHIVALMADSEAFQGIGRVKARKLWERFGEGLYSLLDQGDVDSLSQVLTVESARLAVDAWANHGDSRTLQWLQNQGFEVALGRKVVAFFGAETVAQIEADPYRLLSFCASWRQVDELARTRFGMALDDPRRLQGAIEEACYRLFHDGHTAAPLWMLLQRLESVLGAQTQSFRWRGMVYDALAIGLSNGSYIVGGATAYDIHPLGPLVMETHVAQAVAHRLMQGPLPLLTGQDVTAAIANFEATDGLTLNREQKHAIMTASIYTFVLITGGAGVGKTTMLKALYALYDRADIRIFQLALAGRAAKRMQETTGRPASTLAGFLSNVKVDDLSQPAVVVVDEASMVDIISMSRLCEVLPQSIRMVLVGDPCQLMPVGPGLVLHALTTIPDIPQVELKVVKRYCGSIYEAAMAIREGVWPELPCDESAPIAFLPYSQLHDSEQDGLAQKVLRLYAQAPTQTQILCSRRHGVDGIQLLNALCQAHFTQAAPALLVWDRGYDNWAHTGFHLGDKLLCTRNLWELGLQNGSLGHIIQLEDEPGLLSIEEGNCGEERGPVLAWAEWDDGECRPLYEAMLEDLELGYAITVHKAQGSQWPRVIVPLTGNRLLDRTLIYTAVTRAQQQVLLIGDPDAAQAAVKSPPRAQRRQVALGSLLQRQLQEKGEWL